MRRTALMPDSIRFPLAVSHALEMFPFSRMSQGITEKVRLGCLGALDGNVDD